MIQLLPQRAGQSSAPTRRRTNWLAWLFGAAILATVIAAALHLSEERALVVAAEHAAPTWILAALAVQVATYLAPAAVWRLVAHAGGYRLPLGQAYRLSLAKLFIDQALPSGGLSGATLVAHALERHGMPRHLVMASLVISLISYYAAYVACLAAALAIFSLNGHSNGVLFALSVVFIAYAALLVWAALALSGRSPRLPPRALEHLRLAKAGLQLLNQADRRLVRNVPLLSRAMLWQLLLVFLDVTTLWMLVRAVGVAAPFSGVFASFMAASLLRTVGFIPGGLGTFEATAVFTLKMSGVPIAEALAATLLFRGLSFWLPMVPGLIFSRAALRHPNGRARPALRDGFWAMDAAAIMHQLETSASGLTSDEAQRRLSDWGPNELRDRGQHTGLEALWNQLRNPLLSLLVFAGAASAFTGQWTDAAVILTILLASVGIGYSREYRAATAAAALRERVRTQAKVIRDGRAVMVAQRDVVPGDVFELSAGTLVPADALVLEANDFFVNEGLLTGESFPVEKEPATLPLATPLARRTNCVYLGTNVRSGTARCLVIHTGPTTEFGAISRHLQLRPPQTEFDRGLLRFGYLVTTAMLVMVLLVFAINVALGRPPVETLLFSTALAIGMSPELLPAILSVNLARGASFMAGHGVLVRRLNAIENLGSMTVLCTDKTGTLTEGVVRLEGAYDQHGREDAQVLRLGSINAASQTGLSNPLDDAILREATPEMGGIEKIAEVPYDFTRKLLSVIIRDQGVMRMITKGAFEPVLAICTRLPDGQLLDDAARASLSSRFERWSREGTRVLAVATRELAEAPAYGRDDERELCFVGFLTFLDHPKPGVDQAIADLKQLGVAVKLISGDTKLVAQHVAARVGLRAQRVLTGRDLLAMHDEALWNAAGETDIFAEVDPNQKERIILALRKMGQVVGFLGDGINDAPAMHAADTSISVDQATDVAKDAADFVLLERDLDVIRRGIEEGRITFANTLKYVLTTMSANLGNMLSMALASAFLPFLPLLAGQILLNNFLSDIPAIGLAGDSVDRELIERPRRWNIRFIGRFMVEFGVLSSLFDFLTFAALVGLFAAPPTIFRTAWFTESLLTEVLIALVVRTRRPFFRSQPGRFLMIGTLVIVIVTLALPHLPFAGLLGFTPLPPHVLGAVLAITALYVVVTELAKARLYRRTLE